MSASVDDAHASTVVGNQDIAVRDDRTLRHGGIWVSVPGDGDQEGRGHREDSG
jgi:hypothetical protein